MPYSITTRDGITLRNIPDDVAPDSLELKARVQKIRAAGPRTGAAAIPTAAEAAGGAYVAPQASSEPKPGFIDQAIGTGEAALSAVTGATGGSLGMLGGTLKGLADAILSGKYGSAEAANLVEQAAGAGAQALTYAPRTQAGQEQVQALGSAMQNLVPVAGLTGELGALARATAPAALAGRTAAASTLSKAATAAPAAVRAVAEKIGPKAAPAAGTMGSVGAAGADMAAQRITTAESMPVPIKLTKGQASRDFEQLRFEKETAKDPSKGAPLRTRGEDQNAAILNNFDAWLDATGAQAPDVVAAGRSVNAALVKRAARDKSEVRAAYRAAETAGDMEAPVSTAGLSDLLDASRSAESTAPVLSAARSELARLGGDFGELSLRDMEQLRKFVNKVTGIDPTNQKFAYDIRTAIDAATEGKGGAAYARARALRSRYASTYENHAVISDLLTNRRGMADPKVAVDKVFTRSILQGSPDDVLFLRRVLQTGGEDGAQAWREMQGATLQHIREQATRGVSTDQRGNPVISPAGLDRAIAALDKNGRLQIIFGKQGAQQLRDISDISKYVNTAPPGAINTSNTASVLLAALTEAGVSGSLTGIPVPVLSALRALSVQVKDRRIQRRVQEALRNEAQRQQKRTPPPKTIH